MEQNPDVLQTFMDWAQSVLTSFPAALAARPDLLDSLVVLAVNALTIQERVGLQKAIQFLVSVAEWHITGGRIVLQLHRWLAEASMSSFFGDLRPLARHTEDLIDYTGGDRQGRVADLHGGGPAPRTTGARTGSCRDRRSSASQQLGLPLRTAHLSVLAVT